MAEYWTLASINQGGEDAVSLPAYVIAIVNRTSVSSSKSNTTAHLFTPKSLVESTAAESKYQQLGRRQNNRRRRLS